MGDVTFRDVATNILHVAMSVDSQSVMLQEVLGRVKRLERNNLAEFHLVRINAAITAGLLLSALYRYTAGNRRVR